MTFYVSSQTPSRGNSWNFYSEIKFHSCPAFRVLAGSWQYTAHHYMHNIQ
jgi:hypothetical protein